jgi:Protein of unknown function (DUF3168)
MSAETVLYPTLKSWPAVTSIVGAGDSARIYPDVVPQTVAAPCIAFARVETEYVATLSNPRAAVKALMEVACMSTSRIEADALADAVQDAVAAAPFIPTGRRAELDSESLVWSTVLSFDYWE